MLSDYRSAVDTVLEQESYTHLQLKMLRTRVPSYTSGISSISLPLSIRPSFPPHSIVSCHFGHPHWADLQCHNKAARSFPNPILSHPRHGEIHIKPHNKECVQPAWPCYWQTYNGDRDLWSGPGVFLKNCTWSNGWGREVVKVKRHWPCSTARKLQYITSALGKIRFTLYKINIFCLFNFLPWLPLEEQNDTLPSASFVLWLHHCLNKRSWSFFPECDLQGITLFYAIINYICSSFVRHLWVLPTAVGLGVAGETCRPQSLEEG